MIQHYDKDGEPIDLTTWSDLSNELTYKRVAHSRVASADRSQTFSVSTIWLGTNHDSFGGGPPLIFETMVFGNGPLDLMQRQYSTEDAARQGHEDVVTFVAATMNNPVIMDAVDTSWEILTPRGGKM